MEHIKDAIFLLQASGIKTVAATEKTDQNIYDISLNEPVAIIMGSEDKFMQRFDENGNFVNLPIEEVEEPNPYYTSSHSVDYQIVENEKNESKPES